MSIVLDNDDLRITEDGFIFKFLSKEEAKLIFGTGIELFRMYDDGAEGLIESYEDFKDDIHKYEIGLEVGHINKELSVVNRLELASELAHKKLVENYKKEYGKDGDNLVYEDPQSDELKYTDEAQDMFNVLYDEYETLIKKCK